MRRATHLLCRVLNGTNCRILNVGKRPTHLGRFMFVGRRHAVPLGLDSEGVLADACRQRDYKGLHAFPSNITRDGPPITRDFPPSLLMLQGRSLTGGALRFLHRRLRAGTPGTQPRPSTRAVQCACTNVRRVGTVCDRAYWPSYVCAHVHAGGRGAASRAALAADAKVREQRRAAR